MKPAPLFGTRAAWRPPRGAGVPSAHEAPYTQATTAYERFSARSGPVCMLLSVDAVGGAAIGWTVGPDGTELIANACKLMTAEGQTDLKPARHPA